MGSLGMSQLSLLVKLWQCLVLKPVKNSFSRPAGELQTVLATCMLTSCQNVDHAHVSHIC